MSRKPTGRPPGRPRKVYAPRAGVPEETHLTVIFTPEQKAQAVAAYSIAGSGEKAVRILGGLWGLGARVPERHTVVEWSKQGICATDTVALDTITRYYEARRKVLTFEAFEHAQASLVKRNIDKEKLFNAVGFFKITDDAAARAFQRPQGGTVMDMRGATFIRSSDKPIPAWDHEVEAKVIDGNGDG